MSRRHIRWQSATDGTGALYMGTSLGVLRYTPSTGWTTTALSGISVPVLVTDLHHPGLVFAGTGNGAYYTTDSGATWQYGPDELAGLTVQSISFDPLQPQVVFFGTKTQGILQAYLTEENNCKSGWIPLPPDEWTGEILTNKRLFSGMINIY